MTFVNLTSDPVTCTSGGCSITFAPSGTVATVAVNYIFSGVFVADDGTLIRSYRKSFGPIQNLPDPAPDTVYITTPEVAEAAWLLDRNDVVYPNGDNGLVSRTGQGNF
jgi:hypothetical protein